MNSLTPATAATNFRDLLAFAARIDPSNPAGEKHADENFAYLARNAAVAAAALCADALGMEVWLAKDPAEPAWPVVGIELPTGQVTWHLPAGYRTPLELVAFDEDPGRWDGHDVEEKYRRVAEYLTAEQAGGAR